MVPYAGLMLSRLRARIDALGTVTDEDGPKRRDHVLVALLVIIVVLELILDDSVGTGLTMVSVAAAAFASIATVPWRRVRPTLVLVPVVAQGVVNLVAESQATTGYLSGGVVIPLALGIYAVARWLPRNHAALLILGILVLGPIPDYINGGVPWSERSARPIGIGFVVALASTARYRASLLNQRIEDARLRERQELARELHDVIAHHVSAIAVQAQAGGAVADADPTIAKQVLATIEDQASAALAEMRRMVGILRSDDNRQPHASLDSLRDLATDGPPRITVEIDAPDDLPSSVLAATYRIAQESVTNARRHANGVTLIEVAMRTDDESVTLSVINDGATVSHASPDGYGRIGMTERAEALDGTLTSGPRDRGGWEVHASVPIRGSRS